MYPTTAHEKAGHGGQQRPAATTRTSDYPLPRRVVKHIFAGRRDRRPPQVKIRQPRAWNSDMTECLGFLLLAVASGSVPRCLEASAWRIVARLTKRYIDSQHPEAAGTP